MSFTKPNMSCLGMCCAITIENWIDIAKTNPEKLQELMREWKIVFLELDAQAFLLIAHLRTVAPSAIMLNVTRIVLLKGARSFQLDIFHLWLQHLITLIPHVEEVVVQEQLGNFTEWCRMWPRLTRIYVKERTIHFERLLMLQSVNREFPPLQSVCFDNRETLRVDEHGGVDSCSPPRLNRFEKERLLHAVQHVAAQSECPAYLTINLYTVERSTDFYESVPSFLWWKQLLTAYLSNTRLKSLHLVVGHRLINLFRFNMNEIQFDQKLLDLVQSLMAETNPGTSVLERIVLHRYTETTDVKFPVQNERRGIPCVCSPAPSQYCECSVPKPTLVLWDRRHKRYGHKALDTTCSCMVCAPFWSFECTPLLITIVSAWMRANHRHTFCDSILSLLPILASFIGSSMGQDNMWTCSDVHPFHEHGMTTCGKDSIWDKTVAALPRLASRWLSSRFVKSFVS